MYSLPLIPHSTGSLLPPVGYGQPLLPFGLAAYSLHESAGAPRCVVSRTSIAVLRSEWGLLHAQTFIVLAAALARPNLVPCAKGSKRSRGYDRRCSAQCVVSAAWAGLSRRFSWQLLVCLKSSDPFFQRGNALRRFRQSFPNGRFIKDFQNV